MKTNNVLRIALMLMLAFLIAGVTPVSAKKEKKKKEKKPVEWVMPELTGNETIDDFLKECDSLNMRMKNFENEVPFYEVRKIVNSDNDSVYFAVVDSAGNIRSSSVAYDQYLKAVGTATTLIGDFAVISVSTAAATTALPELGLDAFKYGKYIKTGGQLALQCPAKLKEMIDNFTVQRKAIRAYKNGFDQKTGQLLDPSVDPNSLADLNIGETAALSKTTEEIAAGLAEAAKGNEELGDDIFNDL